MVNLLADSLAPVRDRALDHTEEEAKYTGATVAPAKEVNLALTRVVNTERAREAISKPAKEVSSVLAKEDKAAANSTTVDKRITNHGAIHTTKD